MKNTLIIALVGLLISACGGAPATNNAPNTNTNANAKANTANTPAPNNTPAANTNTNAAKPAVPAAKRIEFKKGEVSGDENVTLAPGASATFVLGVASDQKVYIESSVKGATIKITGGKAKQFSNKDGYYEGLTTMKEDLTFTVTNPTKNEIKTKISISVVDNGG